MNTVRRTREPSRDVIYREGDASLRRVAALLSIIGSIVGFAEFFGKSDGGWGLRGAPVQAAPATKREYRELASVSTVSQTYRPDMYSAEFGTFSTRDEALRTLNYWRQHDYVAFSQTVFHVGIAYTARGNSLFVLRSKATSDYWQVRQICSNIENAGVRCLTTEQQGNL